VCTCTAELIVQFIHCFLLEMLAYSGVHRFLPGREPNIIGARRVTKSKFQDEDSQMLDAAVQNSVATAP
jgi:hypothetical protein